MRKCHGWGSMKQNWLGSSPSDSLPSISNLLVINLVELLENISLQWMVLEGCVYVGYIWAPLNGVGDGREDTIAHIYLCGSFPILYY